MPEPFRYSYNCFLSSRDILQYDLHSLLSVFIQHLELLPEIIEDLSEGPKGVRRYKFDSIRTAVLIDLYLLLMAESSCDYHLETSQRL